MGPECPSCSAPLAPGTGARKVRCGHCSAEVDHPEPLPAGQAVMVTHGGGFQVTTVVSSSSPDAITLASAPPSRLEALVPVLVAPKDLARGDRVFASQGGNWALTWVADVTDDEVMVKHAHPSFQSSFFDQRVPRSQTAVHLDPARRVRRTVWQAYVDQARGNPFAAAIKLFQGAVLLAGVGVVVLVFGTMAWSFVQALFR